MATVYELTVYHDDDVAELFDVSTDPAHARPYLKAPTGFPEQEVQLSKGTASIGQVNLQIVDVPTVANDQDTGYFTAQLAGAAGYSALNGHRALLTEDVDGAGPTTVIDGVMRSVRLLDTFSSFELELRDIRERERKTKAFTETTTPTILPRGVLDGYGVQFTVLGLTSGYPIAPTLPLAAIYRQGAANWGEIIIDIKPRGVLDLLLLTAPQRDALESVSGLAGEPDVIVYNRWKLLWRDKVAGGAYTELTDVAHYHVGLPDEVNSAPFLLERQGGLRLVRVNNAASGDTLPTADQVIEFIIQYVGPPTEDWRFHVQDITAGEFLRNLYRGDYSDEDPRIRYEEAALLALNTPVRMRISEPVDDVREWAEKNIYPIVHAAPTLNADGDVSPITYLLPDVGETLVALDDTNCRPAGGGWSQASDDAVNLVRVTYERLYRVKPTGEPGTQVVALSDQVQSRDVTVEHRIQDSIDLLGEQVLEINSELLSTIGLADGGPWSGDISDDLGARVAERITRMATDRFALGGQYFQLKADRTDADVDGLKPGSWVTAGVSWMPDYGSGERGLNRLAQVIGRRNLDAAWASLTLIDAGTDNAPLTQPTLGAVTADARGVVSIPVTAIGSGSEARIDYAINATEPAADSELWTFLARVTSVPSTKKTQPLAPNTTVWVRARGEAIGRRPSAYTIAVSVAVAATPRVTEIAIAFDSDGEPTVSWVPNAHCLGVRIHFGTNDINKLPTFPDFRDADAADLEKAISGVIVSTGRVFNVQVEPYPGWNGSAVTGAPGPIVEDRAIGTLVLPPRIHSVRVLYDTPNDTSVRIQWEPGPRVNSVWVFLQTLPQPIADSDDPWPDDTTLPTAVLLAGTDLYDVTVPSSENVTFVQLEPRDDVGDAGDVIRVEIQPKSIIAPEIAVKEVRTAATSIVTIDVEDRDLRVTAIEYKKRDAAEGGDTLDATWQTAWTSTVGVIATDQTLQRVINVPAADGLEGELQWRVQYTDIYGTTQTIGDSFKVVNLEATSPEIVLPYTAMQYMSGTGIHGTVSGYLVPDGLDATFCGGAVVMPEGVTIEDVKLVGYRETGSDILTCTLYKVADGDAAGTSIVALAISTNGSWSVVTNSAISELIAADTAYYIVVKFDADNVVLDTRFRAFKVTYGRPAYKYAY